MTSLAKTRKDFNVAFSSLKFQPFSMLAHRQLSKTENIGRTIFIRGYYFLSLSLKKPGPQSKYPVLYQSGTGFLIWGPFGQPGQH